MDRISGIDLPRLERWLAEHGSQLTPPLTAQELTNGRSNLTYRLRDTRGQSLILRRPPLEMVLPTAHDMSREYRIMTCLAGSGVPVPTMVSMCQGIEQIGAPFYVMEWVDGFVIHDEATASPLGAAARRALSEELVAVLNRLHALDIDTVGLGRLGRREGYIERQLYRWERQWQDSKPDELPLVEEVHARLYRNVPLQQGAALVHGDFGLHNLIVNEKGRVLSVIDWELATIGDPLADLGLLLARWMDPPPGFATASELMELYAAQSTRDLNALNYYVAFANWKLACIGAGVYARYRGGAMGNSGVAVDGLWAEVVRRAEIAHGLSSHLR